MIKEFSIQNSDIDLEFSKDLSRYSTMRLKSVGNLATVRSEKALIDLLKILNEKKLNWRMLGWGANQLFPENANDFFYIKIQFDFDKKDFQMSKQKTYFPASVSLNDLISLAMKNEIKGWEAMTGIPASLGGAIFMNAGTRLGEISDFVESIKILNNKQEIEIIKKNNESFSYRKNNFLKKGEVILGATLLHFESDPNTSNKIKKYLNYRKETQPLKTYNCGCVFKNFESIPVGKLIDDLDLKGYSSEHFRISEIHGNFIEHFGSGSLKDLDSFILDIKDKVFKQKGLVLECEVQYSYN